MQTQQPLRAASILRAAVLVIFAATTILGPGAIPARVNAERSAQEPPPQRLYLPNVQMGMPTLQEPEDGAELDTLLPWFEWYQTNIGDGVYTCLAYGTTENPSCQEYFGAS
jgi:hypothetical protein